ncbi:amino acid adenylation domain-containing protein [Brevibacillus borstelensis]|uniref:non-ribosomal peptide synthetase n=1 Tax=Brevibacillus borstelensis TaxID=45462 RepID=UPI0030C2B753
MNAFTREQVQDMYLLSPMQQGMLFHALLDKEKNTHLVQMSISLQGDVDMDLFIKSLNMLVERYDVFRTTFLFDKVKQPLQIVLKERPVPIHYHDLSSLDEQEKEKLVAQHKRQDQAIVFDLTKDPLMRIAILQLAKDDYLVLWSFHHIVMDGWCFQIIFDDLLAIYLALKSGKPVQLEPALPYSSYINWLEKQDKQAARRFWRGYLQDYEQKAALPKRSAFDAEAFRPVQYHFSIDRNLTRQLQQIAHQHQVTLTTVFQTIWGIVLQSYNACSDVVFGSVIAGRPPEIIGIEKMVGLFINTVPCRIKSNKEQTFAQLVQETHQRTLHSQPYEHLPLYDIQNETELKQDLFDHIMVVENYPLLEGLQKNIRMQQVGFTIREVALFEPTNYDMTIMVYPRDEIHVRLDYNAVAYDEAFIKRIEGHIKEASACVATNPQIPLGSITLLSPAEKEKLTTGLRGQTEAVPEKTIHQLFVEQAEKTPEKTAVVFGNRRMTYRELDERSNQIARFLRKKGISADRLIGVLMDRSIEMIAGILGVLKAGGAFVPINPEFPAERIAVLLEDSGAQLLLTQPHLFHKVVAAIEKVDVLDQAILGESSQPVENINQPDDLFYIIYTSGTTGKPKGVMLEHRNMANLMHDSFRHTSISFHERVLQYTSCSFDVCYQEIFSTLLAGGELHLISAETRQNVEELFALIKREEISILFLPVAFLKLVFNEKEFVDRFPSCVKHIVTAGEQLVVSKEFQRFLRTHGVYLHNHYGPSETHVVTTYTIDPQAEIPELPPIGKPISNTGIYILDQAQQLLPEGIVGELYISGANVGRGYLHNPELTASRFLANPYEPQERMYRTGDLARWLPDGNIEYLGRIDHQVKIRGHRIELGEIESHLLNHPGVKDAVVIDRADEAGGKYLCAYVVPQTDVDNEILRDYLARLLPDYMIPSFFMMLERIPVTPNGKTDRRAFPKPEGSRGTGNAFVAPTNDLEKKMARIWEEILGAAPIGIQDSFFSLGGHSLKAILLVSRIKKEFSVEVPLPLLFQTPTIQAVARYIQGASKESFAAIPAASKQAFYPVSSAQKRMMILNQLDHAGTVYNLPAMMLIDGELDQERLERAIAELVDRHESLRTSFHTVDGEAVQRIHEKVKVPVDYFESAEDQMEQIIEQFIRPFDLEVAPLIRAGLVRLGEQRQLLMIDMHHAISDGVSTNLFMKEWAELYQGKALPQPRIHYKDFAIWQNEFFQTEAARKQEAYWISTFSTEIPGEGIPTDYPRPAVQSYEGARFAFRAEKQLLEALYRVGAESGATLYMVLLAAYNVLLSRYSGQENIVVGTPIAGRTHADTESMLGMFVNTLAMRNKPVRNKTFKAFLQEVKQQALQAFEHADYPFEALVDKLGIPRDVSRNPLFDTMFILQNTDTRPFRIGQTTFTPYVPNGKHAKFDLTLEANERPTEIEFTVEYCTKLFKRKTIERLSGHFLQILHAVTKNPEQALHEIEMLTEAEKQELLVAFNDTEGEYLKERTIPQLFEEQAQKSPGQIAAVYGEERLTYRELNEKANRLAVRLREQGVKPEQIVAIMVERSLEMVVGTLAILKAGGAFLPIDPEYPEERIRYMLQDSGAKLVLTQSQLFAKVGGDVQLIDLGDERNYTGDGENPVSVNQPSELAYIIYTSGTTGQPKGVMLEHKGIANLKAFFEKQLKVTPADRVGQFASPSFDASMWEMCMALTVGASLYIIPKETINDFVKFEEYVNRQGITILTLPPTYLIHLAPERLSSVQKLVTAGSATTRALVDKWKDKVTYINAYGPTETTICATIWTANADSTVSGSASVPIGGPILNTRAFIVDEHLHLVPIGQVGELCVSGAGLARGYWNRPELTAEKFVDNPLIPGEKMYMTGDLARWLPNGQIEYLGRIDHQVKIRGHRVEPGEIESLLLRHPAVRETAVIAREDHHGQAYLCAYYVPEGDVTPAQLREYAAKELPAYMIPTYFVALEKMPLTPNDKIDRKALPEPEREQSTGREYEPPRDEREQLLAAIWQEVLGLDRIGIKDNFFECGGHSLKAMAVITRVHKELDVEIPLKALFESPTIAEMASYIAAAGKTSYASIQPAEQRDHYPVSSAQKRMYLLYQLEGAGISYNMPGMMILDGVLERERFEAALQKLIERHEILRTSYEMIGEELIQKIHERVGVPIEYMEAREEEIDQVFRSFVRPFDLAVPPLLRAGLVKVAENRHYFLYDFHHIAVDGESMAMFTREFIECYQGLSLPEPSIQYKDYAVWQKDWLRSDAFKKQETYWLNAFAGELPVVNLPTDFARPSVQSFEGDQVTAATGKQLMDDLYRIANQTGTTLYMVLLAAYNVLLSKYSGQEEIVVGTPISGRSHPDLAHVVGMFVNTLAMRNRPAKTKTFTEFLSEVKEHALQAYENQEYPFETLVEKLGIARDPSRNPLFDTMFILENDETVTEETDQLRFNPYEPADDLPVAKFDLAFHMTESPADLLFRIEYATKLFTRSTIERMSRHFLQILHAVTKNPEQALHEIEMLTEAEKQELLVAFNDTEGEYLKERTIPQLFEEQAQKSPGQIAAVYGEERLTYRELNEKANRLAVRLREQGVKPEQIVAIMVERSLEMVVGTLAILKAGGAFLPIDPEYPEERIRYMLQDSGAKLVLTQSQLFAKVGGDVQLIDLGDERNYTGDGENPVSVNQPSDLAYIIYTSGTTGQPKGVMLEHKGIANLKAFFEKQLKVTPADRVGQFASPSFDASMWEMCMALTVGASLHIIPKETINDFVKFEEYVNRQGITILTLPPTYLIHLAPERLSSVQKLVTAGSATTRALVDKWKDKVTYINAYGPTETTICATIWTANADPADSGSASVPIGGPILNTRAFIVDEHLHLVPIGQVGELCVSGAGLARGYWNRPELTAEKFVDNPLIPGEKMYRTGDLARWLPNGQIEYLGRIDHQVKIRGHRVEPGEIESLLLRHPAVRETAVIAREDHHGQAYLCAYYVPEGDVTPAQLREYAAKELPAYMIPSYFVALEKMPLTPNDKIDRKALPEPEREQSTGREYEPPRDEREQLLAAIWQEVLGLERIGIKDNFFECGGDSIKAIQASTRLHTAGWKLDMRDLFQYPTIEQVAPYVTPNRRKIDQGLVEGEVELTPIQHWFFEQNYADMHHWNQAVMLYRADGFDEELIQQAFRKIVEHHDGLRMVYRQKNGKIRQVNRGLAGDLFHFHCFDLTRDRNISETIPALATEVQASIDLAEGPLVKLALFQTNDGDHLLIAIHHLVIDGVSWRILFEDFATAYTQALHNEDIVLPEKTDSFKDWSAQLQEYAFSDELLRETAYWEQLERTAKCKPLSTDMSSTENLQKHSRTVKTSLTLEQTENLLRHVNHAYRTETHDILLTALGLSIKEWLQAKQIVVNLEGHGREDILPRINISRTVGWFTSQYPVVLDMEKSDDMPLQIKLVKENLRRIPKKGIGYDILRYLTAREFRPALQFSLRPEINFNYLGQFDSDQKQGAFGLSPIQPGHFFSPQSQRPFVLDISAVVEEGQLHISFHYNSEQYVEDTIVALAESYRKHLLVLMEHCMSIKEGELTPSDLADDDLSMEELANILELI